MRGCALLALLLLLVPVASAAAPLVPDALTAALCPSLAPPEILITDLRVHPQGERPRVLIEATSFASEPATRNIDLAILPAPGLEPAFGYAPPVIVGYVRIELAPGERKEYSFELIDPTPASYVLLAAERYGVVDLGFDPTPAPADGAPLILASSIAATRGDDSHVRVQVGARNFGTGAGAAEIVVEGAGRMPVVAGEPHAPLEPAARLAGERVELAPGEEKALAFDLGARPELFAVRAGQLSARVQNATQAPVRAAFDSFALAAHPMGGVRASVGVWNQGEGIASVLVPLHVDEPYAPRVELVRFTDLGPAEVRVRELHLPRIATTSVGGMDNVTVRVMGEEAQATVTTIRGGSASHLGPDGLYATGALRAVEEGGVARIEAGMFLPPDAARASYAPHVLVDPYKRPVYATALPAGGAILPLTTTRARIGDAALVFRDARDLPQVGCLGAEPREVVDDGAEPRERGDDGPGGIAEDGGADGGNGTPLPLGAIVGALAVAAILRRR